MAVSRPLLSLVFAKAGFTSCRALALLLLLLAALAVAAPAEAQNTAPTASNGAVTTLEDTNYPFDAADFNYVDADSDALESVSIETLPDSGKGTLNFDGTPLTTIDLPKVVAAMDLAAGKLVYAPPEDEHGSAFASFTFKVNDGTVDSAPASTMTVNVTSAPDPPGPPASLAAAAGDTRVRLVWTAPSDNGGSAITRHEFRHAAGASVPAGTAWTQASGNYTALISGLANGTAHAFEVRAVNAFGNGEAATGSATPAAAVCAAPALGGRRNVWSATMTVGRTNSSGIGKMTAGLRSGVGSLSPTADLMIGSTPYRVEVLATVVSASGNGRMLGFETDSGFTAPVKAALQLHFCSDTRNFSGGDYNSSIPGRVFFAETDLDFSIWNTREVALSLPANNPATGAPEIESAIAGHAHVGRTLTAAQGTLADADRLPATLDYAWFRVDSTNAETEIAGAAASTYTPTADDLGHRIKAKVSFYDDLGSPEEAESALTPEVEQPTLSISDASVTEGQPLTFTVTLSPATDLEVTVDWNFLTDSYTAGMLDLTGTTNGTLTFLANQTSKTIAVNTVDDDLYEADEIVGGLLINPVHAVLDDNGDGFVIAVGTIINDEAAPTLTLVLADSSIQESDAPAPGRQDQTTVTAILDVAVEHTLRITLDSTELQNLGLTGQSAGIHIEPRSKTTTDRITLTAMDNNIDAPDRVVQVTVPKSRVQFAGTPANYPLDSQDFTLLGATLTIEDDEVAPTVTLAVAPSPMRESDDVGTPVTDDEAVVTATLSHPSSAATTVAVSAAAVPPAVDGDFTLSANKTLTIAALGTTSTGTVTLSAEDNSTDAPDKEVTLSGVAVNGRTDSGGPHIVQPQSLEHVIRDDEDTPKVELVLVSSSIDENGGSTTALARLSHASSQVTVVTIAPEPDVFTVGGALTIPAGQTDSATVTLTAVDNETDAPDRTVAVAAMAVNGQGVVNPDPVTLTITDDDPMPVVTLQLTPDAIREADDPGEAGNQHRTTVTAVLDRPSSQPTTITVSAEAQDPAVAADFRLSASKTLTIAAMGTTSTGAVTITARDNEVDAPDKTVTVSGAAVNTQGIQQPADAPLTVRDEDPAPAVTLELSRDATGEDDSAPVTVTARLDRPSSADTTISVSVEAVSPAVDEDFTLTGSTLTISAGQTMSTGSVEITPENNETDAPDKTFTVSGAAVNDRTDAEQDPYIVQPQDKTLTIRDDDPAPVARLLLTPVSIDEAGGTTVTTVTAVLDRPSSDMTTIAVSAAAVSPAVEEDFTLTGTTLTIAPGSEESTETVTIEANDNRTDAPHKQVTVSATASNGQGVRRSLTSSAGTANVALADAPLAIIDDDPPPQVRLEFTETSIRESDDTEMQGDQHRTTVEATLSHPSSERTTVTIEPAAGDYTLSGGGRLTIPAGDEMSSGSVTLTAVDNNTDAPDKQRDVVATANNTQGILQPALVPLTIEDDEPPPTVTLVLGAANDTINENNGSTTVRAQLSHPSSEPTTVTVSALPVSPALAEDFDITGGELTISAGQTRSTSTATIRAVNNNTDAPNKQVTVSAAATNPKQPAPSLEGDPADVILTIADDEPPPTVTLRLSQTTIGEDGGEAAVTAELNHPSSETTEVTVSTAPQDTLTTEMDITLNGNTLTITAGLTASVGSVTIAANDNDLDTANKRVTVSATAENPKLPPESLQGDPASKTLTIADDDVRGIAFSPAAAVMREGFSSQPSTTSYKVALSSQPTADVTVTVAGAGGLQVATAASPQTSDFGTSNTLTFTATDWSTAQTVTLRSTGDNNATDNTVSIRHAASGGDYGSVRANLPVTVLDTQPAGAVLALTVDRAEIPEGGGVTVVTVTATLGGFAADATAYDVTLKAEPGTAAATDFSSNEASLRIGGSTSTFQTSKEIAVTPTDDGLDETDETITVTATIEPVGTGGAAATVTPATVTILDDDTRGVTVDPLQIELDEGSSQTYTVSLDSEPTGAVTVALSKTGSDDIAFQPASLSFDSTNWMQAQMVSVSAAEDGDPLNDQATISHTVSGADYGANNVRAERVQATVQDNDGRRVIVSDRDLTVAEAGTETYTVKLGTRPTGSVTVRLIRTGDPDVSVSPPSLSFTTGDWDTEKVVTISAAEDADTDDDRAAISHRVSGADYGGSNVPGPDVRVTVTDSGHTTTTGTISISPMTFREGTGRRITVEVALDGTRATDTNVTVLIRPGTAEATDFRADPAAFVLTVKQGNTRASRTIRFDANRDSVVENLETVVVEATAAGLTFDALELTIKDGADMRSIVVSKQQVQVREQGQTASYTVKLGSEPTGAVTVTAAVTGAEEVTVEPPSLSFTALNWNRTQAMTVQAAADPDGDNETGTITLTAAGADYDNLAGRDISVRVTDDDPAATGVRLGVSPDRVDEDGGPKTLTVTASLDGAARATDTDVTVTVNDRDGDPHADFEPVEFSITIVKGRRSAAGTFTFTPIDDERDELPETVRIEGTVDAADSRGSDLPVEYANLVLIDDDRRGVKTPTEPLLLDEGGTESYTLVLTTKPTGNVTVGLWVSGDGDVTVSPSSLTFTPDNWDTTQPVTVSAAADEDAAGDTASVNYDVSGADYTDDTIVLPTQVTVRDLDRHGVTVSKPSVQFPEGSRDTYTVVLDTKPTATVTVRPELAAGSDSDVRVTPSSLRFTTSNWSTPQRVTVSAGQDSDSDADNASITHAVSGGDYGEANVVAPTVSVRVSDDDVASTAIMLTLSTNQVRESASRTQITVTAELDAAPRAEAIDVILSLEGVTGGAQVGADFAAIDPVTLTIRSGSKTGTARVTVTPVRDDIDEGAGETLRLLARTDSGLPLQPASSFDVTIEDDDEKGLVLSRSSLRVQEEGSAAYTVKLNSQPTATVTVDLAAAGAHAGDLTVEPQQLTFTADNWNVAQPVTVSAAADPDGDDDPAAIAHTASGGDYGSVTKDLPVTVDDIDQTSRFVELSLSPERVQEGGGPQTIAVTAELNAASRGSDTNVEVQATGGTADAGVDFTDFGTVTVLIPQGQTSGTQNFTFTPADDSIDEGVSETVVLGGTVQGLTVRTATLTLVDDDGRGIELPSEALTLTEGGTVTYDVSLATQPTGTVTVRVTVAGDRDVTVEPDRLTFTPDDWNTAQEVTVTAAADDDAVADTAELRHTASGADYSNFEALAVGVEVTDTSVRGVTVSETALSFREGDRETYTVVLETQPTGTVTVRPTVVGDASITVSPSALSFTTSSWKTAKTVRVTAAQDSDSVPDTATITHPVSGADYGDAGVTAADVTVSVSDDETPSTEVRLRLSQDKVGESAGRTQITVSAELDGAAEASATEVTLTLAAGTAQAEDFVAVGPVTLTIPTGRTEASARVPVEPVSDRVDEEDETVTISAAFASRDANSQLASLIPESFDVTIEDDDEKGLVLSRSSLRVQEEGSAAYTVKLNSQPTATVTVDLAAAGAHAGDLTVEPQQLTFTADNWNVAQPVTVSAAADPDGDDDPAAIAHTASGGDYGSVTKDLPVTVDDIDQTSRFVELSLSPERVQEGGGPQTIAVTAELNAASRGSDTNVEVQATGGTADAGVDFTDFGTVTVLIPQGQTSGTQNFTFTPADDSIDEGVSETVVLGGTVQGLTVRTATLTLVDDDGRGIELPSEALTLTEGGTVTYDVSLATQPTGTVTVRVTVAGDRDVTVEPDRLTFTPDDWNTAQEVTVTAAADDDAVADTAELRHTASGADYSNFEALAVGVEVTDTSVRGVTVSETALSFREGDRETYTVVLETQPTGTVTVRPTVVGDASITVSPSALSFTTSSWKTAKTVRVTAAQDSDSVPDTATITHPVSGADYGDAGVTAADVTVSVSDDETPSTEVRLRLSQDKVGESAGRTQITVSAELDGAAEASATEVTLTLAAGTAQAEDFVAVGPVTLTIPTGRTEASARVPVEPVSDRVDEEDETVTISAAFASRDANSQLVSLIPESFDVTIEDDDERGLELSQSSLTVREEHDAIWTVRLRSAPTATVTVVFAAQGTGASDLTVTPSSLTFTAQDWNATQEVTVAAAGDTDSDDESVTIAHTASGGDYGSVTADLSVTVLDKTGGPSVSMVEISPMPPQASTYYTPSKTRDEFAKVPDEAVHGRGTTLTFTLTFNHAVTVTFGSEARPELVLDVFGRARRARYAGGSGTRELTFTWSVKRGDYDPNGITVSKIVLNGATIRDADGRDTEPATFRRQDFKAHRVRGGFFEMRLVVTGATREGEPFQVEVRRTGGSDEHAAAFVQAIDSAVLDPATGISTKATSFAVELHAEDSREDPDGDWRTGSYALPVPGDGGADAGRTLTLRLVGSGGTGLVAWYDLRDPVEATVRVTEGGIAAAGPRLSVGPADVHEPDTGTAPLTFRVCLWTGSGCPDPGQDDDFENYDGVTHEVKVDYATADGTATVREGDYSRKRGTLTFDAGETVKTVEVKVLADRHDEGIETVWLELSDPKGAGIGRGRNFGQIHNTGPIPKAWIARFGRTVAEQVLDAVEGRMTAPGSAGAAVTLAGERVGGQVPHAEAGEDAAREEEALREALRLADWLKGETDAQEARERRSRAVTGRDLLTGSSFALAAETANQGLVSLWGRGAVTRFEGREGDLSLDGEVETGMLGADWSWGSGAGSSTAGLIVSHSEGEGGYSGAHAAEGAGDGSGSESRAGLSGRVEATLTGAFPWARHALTERLELWGAAGYGAGELTVTPKKPGTDEDGAALRTELDLKMAAAGLRGTMLDGGSDGLTLTAKTDAMVVQTASGRVKGVDPGSGSGAGSGNLEPARATVTRLRLGVEASRPFAVSAGATLTPSLEVGLRHDGGDAETGFGLDLGGGLTLSDPKRGLQAELRGRGLLSHESKGFRERGFSGSLAWKQKPASDRGATLTLTQTLGGSSSGGADALLTRTALDGLASNDNGSGTGAGNGGGDDLKSRRLELKLGYGFSAFGDRFTLTPEAGVGLSDTGRDYSLGWRLVLHPGAGGDSGSLELSFEARRRESANDDAPAEHQVGLKLTARF